MPSASWSAAMPVTSRSPRERWTSASRWPCRSSESSNAGLPVDAVDGRHVILDAPPGASCPVVETMRGADVVLLVTEPTPFGLHDLKVAVQVARDELHLPVAVIINRDGVGDAGVEAYCQAEAIPILLRIPLERTIAEGIAQGQTLVEIHPMYRERFADLWSYLVQMAAATARSGVVRGESR